MAGPNTAATEAARTELYLGTAQQGVVGGRPQNFYSGTATKPTSFTGNQILGVHSNGVGASLLNGVGPVPDNLPPCEEPVIFSVVVNVLAANLEILVGYTRIPGDIYQLFTTGGVSYTPVSVEELGPVTRLLFPDEALMAPGTYNLKIMRDSDPANCFTIQYGVHTISGMVCTIVAGAWTSPGGAPFPPAFFGAGPPLSVEITGSGFLSCPIGVAVNHAGGGGPPTQAVTSLVVVDDTTITFDVGRVGIGGFSVYEATVFCTDDPTCSDVADNPLFYIVF